ncbi:hypothetical protein [Caballeronia sp. S22]|uniref:hypothetical protein n=1 Tax=Caballeronia sp. S22 TaxID=3137182 RepID=UPI003530A343
MNTRRIALAIAAAAAVFWSNDALAASSPVKTLPLQDDIWITGTIQRSNGQYAPGESTTILLDRPASSPCNNKVITDILLGERGAPAPTLLLPYLDQRVVVRGRVTCPKSGIQFSPQPDIVFPVW